MKVRMIIGEHTEYDSSIPVPQAFLACISFPMEMTYHGGDLDHPPDTVTLDNEDELAEWATEAFESYEIWNMEVPLGSFVEPERRPEHLQEAADAKPYAGEIENMLMDCGWLVREHPREAFAAEADAPPEDGTLSLVAFHDGRIVYFDWSTTHSSHGHTNDPLLPHQFAESVKPHHSR